jgi:hypothetical protein
MRSRAGARLDVIESLSYRARASTTDRLRRRDGERTAPIGGDQLPAALVRRPVMAMAEQHQVSH